MFVEILAERYGIRRVYPEDCQLCISGYTGKRCPYLVKVKGKRFCVREAAKNDPRLRF
jgi:hypothetical protein